MQTKDILKSPSPFEVDETKEANEEIQLEVNKDKELNTEEDLITATNCDEEIFNQIKELTATLNRKEGFLIAISQLKDGGELSHLACRYKFKVEDVASCVEEWKKLLKVE
jgi:uncharacterized protein YhaN